MPVWMKAASVGGSILVIIALVIALLKTLIAFVGFISVAVKIIIVLVFLAVIVGVGLLAFRAWQENRKNSN
jgi:hypothetical protein